MEIRKKNGNSSSNFIIESKISVIWQNVKRLFTLMIRFCFALIIFRSTLRRNLFPYPRDFVLGRTTIRPLYSTRRALFPPSSNQGHQTFDPSWGRGFGSMALRMEQDRRGVRVPTEIDTRVCYPPTTAGRLIYAFKVARWNEIVRSSRRAQFCDFFVGCNVHYLSWQRRYI